MKNSTWIAPVARVFLVQESTWFDGVSRRFLTPAYGTRQAARARKQKEQARHTKQNKRYGTGNTTVLYDIVSLKVQP